MDCDKLIDRLNTKLQAYAAYTDSEFAHVMEDAITAIEALRAELARVTAERDGAIKDLKKWNICATCGHYSPYGKKSNCKIKSAHISGGNWAGCSEWEWRGNQKED